MSLKPIDRGPCIDCGRVVQNRNKDKQCDNCKPKARPWKSNTQAYWENNCPEMLEKSKK